MAYANIMWQKPDYHEPLLGDSDDNDLRGLLTTAALLFGDGTIKSRAFETPDYENFFIFRKKINKPIPGSAQKTPAFCPPGNKIRETSIPAHPGNTTLIIVVFT